MKDMEESMIIEDGILVKYESKYRDAKVSSIAEKFGFSWN